MTLIVAIAGASASGKSTLAKQLVTKLQHSGVDVGALSMDDYCQPKPAHVVTPEQIAAYRSATNFDEPGINDIALLHHHLTQLSQRRAINRPHFDFASCSRLQRTTHFRPADVVIVEGLFALCGFETLNLGEKGFSVFITSHEHANFLERRVLRDAAPVDLGGRGLSSEITRRKDADSVYPGFVNHILPCQKHADMVIYNDYAVPSLDNLTLAEQRDAIDSSRVVAKAELDRHTQTLATRVMMQLSKVNPQYQTIKKSPPISHLLPQRYAYLSSQVAASRG